MIGHVISTLAIVATMLSSKAAADVYPIELNGDVIWPDWAVNNAETDEETGTYGATFRWGKILDMIAENKKGFVYWNSNSMPTITDAEVSFAITILPPCTIDAPHYHPFGGEYMMTVRGVTQYHWIDPVSKKYKTFLGCATPDLHPDCPEDSYLDMGLMHKGTIQWQSNPGCEYTAFYGVFNADKPGRENVVTLYLNSTGTDPLQERTSLGLSKQQFDKIDPYVSAINPYFLELPTSDMKECMKRCNKQFEINRIQDKRILRRLDF
eukprot:TRINITY_DN2869_c0_g1_i9.p3 TRINITY_DN2869_c0_g1~~TRINITY_DN2869_c0_g1_i9.p3  ORF type:complete len:266 (+),score=22.65 TRINITY_DN2869_c0_g1_i9:838-1635(+)